MWDILVQTNFTARYPSMLHSALLKATTKPQIFKSCGLAEPPGKPTSSWGHSEAAPFIQPWHFSTGEEGIASNQSQDRISTSGSAHSPLYVPVWVTLHIQSACTAASSPLLPALPPWSLCPSSSLPPQLAGREQEWQPVLDQQPSSPPHHHHPTTALIPTPSSASSASPQWFAGDSVLSAQKNPISCKHWREQCSQTEGHSKPAVPQHRAQS